MVQKLDKPNEFLGPQILGLANDIQRAVCWAKNTNKYILAIAPQENL